MLFPETATPTGTQGQFEVDKVIDYLADANP